MVEDKQKQQSSKGSQSPPISDLHFLTWWYWGLPPTQVGVPMLSGTRGQKPWPWVKGQPLRMEPSFGSRSLSLSDIISPSMSLSNLTHNRSLPLNLPIQFNVMLFTSIHRIQAKEGEVILLKHLGHGHWWAIVAVGVRPRLIATQSCETKSGCTEVWQQGWRGRTYGYRMI